MFGRVGGVPVPQFAAPRVLLKMTGSVEGTGDERYPIKFNHIG
jgi:hypothetical protein